MITRFTCIFLACASFLSIAHANPAATPPPEKLANMLAAPGLPDDPEQIDWAKLPTFKGQTSVVTRGVQNETAFMHHPFIVVFDGKVFASWNDGYVGEDFAGQRVRY